MKYIILAALIASSFAALTCPANSLSKTYFKGTQYCFAKLQMGGAPFTAYSDPVTPSACPAGFELKTSSNGYQYCDEGAVYEANYEDFSDAQQGQTNQCVSLSSVFFEADYNTKAGCIIGGQAICNSCATATTGSVGKFPTNGTCSGSCSANCLACTDATTCIKCDSKYGLVSGACVACDTTKAGADCLNCDGNKDVCKKCSTGFGIISGLCTACDETTKCNYCDGDKTLCSECKPTYYLDSAKACQDCNAGANIANVATCSANPETAISNIDTCDANYYLTTDKGCLLPVSTGCLEIDSTTKKCSKCYNSKYVKSSDNCVLITSIKTGCIAAVDAATGVAAVCTDCGKFVSTTSPYENKIYAYYYKTNDCIKCGEYCKTCEEGKLCTACISNEYHPDNDSFDSATKCIPCGTTNAGASECAQTAAGAPTDCIDTQKPFSGNATCNDPCDATCKTCGADGKCLTCSSSKYLTDAKACTACSANCDKCADSTGKCTECNSGYALASDGTCGASKITNCAKSTGKDGLCTLCFIGYYNKAGVCTACSDSSVTCAKAACPVLTGGSTGNASVLAFCSTLLLAVLAFLF